MEQNNYFHKKYKDNIERYRNGDNLKKHKKFEDYMIITIKNIIIFLRSVVILCINCPKEP